MDGYEKMDFSSTSWFGWVTEEDTAPDKLIYNIRYVINTNLIRQELKNAECGSALIAVEVTFVHAMHLFLVFCDIVTK